MWKKNIKELDLHGKNRFEANQAIKTFLLESYQQRERQVKITYGTSGHVMRKTTIEELEINPYVKEYENSFDLTGKIVYIKEKKK